MQGSALNLKGFRVRFKRARINKKEGGDDTRRFTCPF